MTHSSLLFYMNKVKHGKPSVLKAPNKSGNIVYTLKYLERKFYIIQFKVT